MEELEKSTRTGIFTIPPDKEMYGELKFDGPETSLCLHDKDYIATDMISGQCVTGILHDLTKVSLIQCVRMSSWHVAGSGKGEFYSANFFPHYIVHGNHHIDPTEKNITKIHFVVDDANKLFYDFDAFGSVIDARPFIDEIAHANAFEREVLTGPHPQILYFTGKTEIFVTDSVLGKISATHNPSHNLGGPDGVRLENTIFVTLAFKEAVAFDCAIFDTSTLLNYLEMLVGRPQNLLKLYLNTECDDESLGVLEVYWSHRPQRSASNETRRPHAHDVLLDAVRQPDAFSRVLGSWLDRQEAWHDARYRFSSSFAKQQYYDVERLIASANMFDILPSSAVPSDVQLPEDLEAAVDDCRETFKKLTVSPERDSVLGALGRVRKSNLKRKICHRVQPLIDIVGDRFPEIVTVTDKAVNCRNHYVHGSLTDFDYDKNFNIVMFFTDTLEFVFAASDLIEAGWDVKAWIESGTTMSHPFGRYRVGYAENLRQLKALLEESAASS